MRSKPVLGADEALLIGQAAAAEAARQGWPVAIAIVDDGGHLLWLLRLDAAAPSTATIAQGKARTAALTRRDSGFYEKMVQTRPAFISAAGLDSLLEGGLPIVVDGHCIGGIGVSGVKSEQDVQVARAGIDTLQRRP